MQPVDLSKQRDIVFDSLPTDQAVQAARLLNRLPAVEAQAIPEAHSVVVNYQVTQWCLEELEAQLLQAGFHLEGSILQRIRRALVHYTEAIQRENLHFPEREHKSKEVFIHAWTHHPHGDHDETPEELREYR